MNSVIIIKGTLKEILVCVLPAFHTIKTTCLLSLPPPPPPSPLLPSYSVDSEMLVSAPTPHSNWTITACTLTTRQLTANGQVEVQKSLIYLLSTGSHLRGASALQVFARRKEFPEKPIKHYRRGSCNASGIPTLTQLRNLCQPSSTELLQLRQSIRVKKRKKNIDQRIENSITSERTLLLGFPRKLKRATSLLVYFPLGMSTDVLRDFLIRAAEPYRFNINIFVQHEVRMTNERELYEKNPIHHRLSSEIAITIFSGGEWPQTP